MKNLHIVQSRTITLNTLLTKQSNYRGVNMSYSNDPVVEDIILTVINDGNGSECGMTYQERLNADIFQFRNACRKYSPKATHNQRFQAAQLLFEYYENHKKEILRLKNNPIK